jgi:hypothetical protein
MGFEEEMEHAAHAGHEGHGESGGIGKYIGMTMAILGVMLALTSALLGGSRNKLIATMVEQTSTAARYQAIASKHRTLVAQLQQLHAMLPADPADFEKSQKELDNVTQSADKKDANVIAITRLETDKILNTVTPSPGDVLRFVQLVHDYSDEKEKAHKWVESYEDLIHVYEQASEHYEWGQLCAEFGIVLASIALLIHSRAAWFGSMTFGAAALGLMIFSYVTESSGLAHAKTEVEESKKAYFALNMDEKGKAGDEELFTDVKRIEKAQEAANTAPTTTATHAPEHAPEHH